MLRFIGAALLFTASAFLLRQFGWRGAPVFAVISSVVLLSEMTGALSEIFGYVENFGRASDVGEPLTAALKTLGAGYLFGISSDVCRELGESGIAKAIEAVGRVEIIAIVFPYFEKILKVGVELVG